MRSRDGVPLSCQMPRRLPWVSRRFAERCLGRSAYGIGDGALAVAGRVQVDQRGPRAAVAHALHQLPEVRASQARCARDVDNRICGVPMIKCNCHEWYDVAEIGDWTQGSGGEPRHARPVRQIVAIDDIWKRSDTDHETLLAGIRVAGGIACKCALMATSYIDGHIGLNNGVHRWAVAVELGIERVPVEMLHEQESLWPPLESFESWAQQANSQAGSDVHAATRSRRGHGCRPRLYAVQPNSLVCSRVLRPCRWHQRLSAIIETINHIQSRVFSWGRNWIEIWIPGIVAPSHDVFERADEG